MPIMRNVAVSPVPIPGFVGSLVAQGLVFQEIGIPNKTSESVYLFHETKLRDTTSLVSIVTDGKYLSESKCCID